MVGSRRRRAGAARQRLRSYGGLRADGGDTADVGRARNHKTAPYVLLRKIQLSLEQSVKGSVAELSKALVLGTSLFGGVGSNPTAAKLNF